MKVIPKIICVIIFILFSIIHAHTKTCDTETLITSILPNIMPSEIDSIYYGLDNAKKDIILADFFEYNKWRFIPLQVKIQKLTQNDAIAYLSEEVPKYTAENLNHLRWSLGQNIEVNWVNIKINIVHPENHTYVPYIQAITPGSINSKFAFKIYHKDCNSYIRIGTYKGEKRAYWYLNRFILHGAFCSQDNNLILVTKGNNIYMKTYTCGYTPEQMLCIIAYRNAKFNKKELKELIKTQFFTSMLKNNYIIAKKIKNKIDSLIGQK